MNSYFTSYRFLFVIVTFISVVAFGSCKKILQDESGSSDGARVTFKVVGVNPITNISNSASANRVASSAENLGRSNVVNDISKNVNLEIEQSVENIISAVGSLSMKPGLDQREGASEIVSKKAALSYLPSNIKFRVVVINSLGDIVYNEQATSDDEISFNLINGQQYTWYSYSYGTTDDIPAPPSNEVIETPKDKDFLYAKSITPFTVQGSNGSISIVYDHQLALISIELDYDRLYATIPTNLSDPSSISENFDWSFDVNSPPNFLYSGDFSLRTGQITSHQSYSGNLNAILKDDPNSRNVKVAHLYTTGPPIGVTPSSSFSVTLNLLKVKYPNTSNLSIINLIGGSQSVHQHTFTNLETTPGKKYVAKFKLKYTFPSLKILHVSGTSASGYTGENISYGSYRMLTESKNFSTSEANSIVRTYAFTHETIATSTGLEASLHLTSGTPPDIVIVGGTYVLSANDITALVDYLDRGGVLFLMSGGVLTTTTNLASHQSFLRSLFGNSSIEAISSLHAGGSVYNMVRYDDGILNGPFGDVQSVYWGKNDPGNKTIVLQNLPAGDVVEYSGSNPVNSTDTESVGTTMFKHKSRHFFWVGDGGFIYAPTAYGKFTYTNYYPFATNGASPNFYLPVPRPYGVAGGEVAANNYDVYNSVIYANFISWAIVNANFFGINYGGLGLGPYHEF